MPDMLAVPSCPRERSEMAEHKHDPTRRRLDEGEVDQLRRGGKVKTLGGFTVASLLVSMNEAGLGPEDVEICGTANGFGIELWAVEPGGDE